MLRLHCSLLLGLAAGVGACADSGWVDDASVQNSIAQLRKIDAAMLASDGMAGVFAVRAFGAELANIQTAEGPRTYSVELPPHDGGGSNVPLCDPGACTFDYAGFHSLYFGDSFRGDVTRTGDIMTFEIEASSSFRMLSSASSKLVGTLTVTPTEVDGTIRMTGSSYDSQRSTEPSTTKTERIVSFHHVSSMLGGCATSGSVTLRAWLEENGDTTYDFDASHDVGASCP